MNWKLYRKDDPNTWPEIDCPMLVYIDNKYYHEFLAVAEWVTWCHMMYDIRADEYLYTDECYYTYISYVPNGYKAIKTKKCSLNPEHRCEYEDDGYCFDLPRHVTCKYAEEVTKYVLNDNKRIWKEFE